MLQYEEYHVYEIDLGEITFGFATLVSEEGYIALKMDRGPIIFPQFRKGEGDDKKQVNVSDVSGADVDGMINQTAEILSAKTRSKITIDEILRKSEPLKTQMLKDFSEYQPPQ